MLKALTLPRVRFGLFASLLVLAPLSKYPSVALPLFNFTSFRIGLYQILAVAFVATCAMPAWRKRTEFIDGQHAWAAYALALLGGLGLASVSWSLYKSRSLLLALSLALLVAVVFAAWWYVRHELTTLNTKKLVQYMLFAGVSYSVLAIVQLVIFTFTDATLGILCKGCLADVFGFPRVNGLAAEPQFFANALLPFVFTALYAVMHAPSRLAWMSLVATTGAIGLTFSRGAYLALAVGLLVTTIVLLRNAFVSLRQLAVAFAVIAVSILGSLCLLVASASVRYADTPNIAYETVDSILEHLTMGRINLPEKTVVTIQVTNPDDQFVSPGFIEASNEERSSAASLALDAWRSNFMTILLGVGLGNLGPFVVANIQATAPENLTVYVYYVLVLAELGIVGLVSLLLVFGSALKALLRKHSLRATLVFGLLVAFLVQFFFYGTYINNVYVWVWLGVALGATSFVKATPVRKKRV